MSRYSPRDIHYLQHCELQPLRLSRHQVVPKQVEWLRDNPSCVTSFGPVKHSEDGVLLRLVREEGFRTPGRSIGGSQIKPLVLGTSNALNTYDVIVQRRRILKP